MGEQYGEMYVAAEASKKSGSGKIQGRGETAKKDERDLSGYEVSGDGRTDVGTFEGEGIQEEALCECT